MPRCRDNVQLHDDRDCRKIQVLFLHLSDWKSQCRKTSGRMWSSWFRGGAVAENLKSGADSKVLSYSRELSAKISRTCRIRVPAQ